MAAEPDKLAERWPVLSGQLEAALRDEGEHDLAAQVGELRVHELCGCGDDFCQSFYTQPRPDGAFGPGHRNVVLYPDWDGWLVLDVVDGRIMYVEVLYRDPLD